MRCEAASGANSPRDSVSCCVAMRASGPDQRFEARNRHHRAREEGPWLIGHSYKRFRVHESNIL